MEGLLGLFFEDSFVIWASFEDSGALLGARAHFTGL